MEVVKGGWGFVLYSTYVAGIYVERNIYSQAKSSQVKLQDEREERKGKMFMLRVSVYQFMLSCYHSPPMYVMQIYVRIRRKR